MALVPYEEEEKDWSKYRLNPEKNQQQPDTVQETRDWSKYRLDGKTSGAEQYGSSSSAFDSSVSRLEAGVGRFAGQYLPDMIPGVPNDLIGWGNLTAQQADAKLSTYRAKHHPDITDEDWQTMLPSIWEKVRENGALTLSQLAGSTVGGWLVTKPGPAKLVGGTILLGTGLLSASQNIEEVASDHLDISGQSWDNMSSDDRVNIYFTAGENTIFDMLNPFRWAKAAGKGTPMPKNAKEMETYLDTAQKQNLIIQLKLGSKEMFKSGTIGGATESLQLANTARTSAKGFDAKGAGDYITEGVVGAFSEGAAGSVGGTSIARAHNKTIKEGTKALTYLNERNKLQAGDDYFKEINSGPTLPGFDVIPETYRVPEQKDKGTIRNLGGLAYDKLIGRSTGVFKEALKNAKTGKDVDLVYRRAYGSFADSESGTGMSQEGTSFNTAKHTKLGLYATDFAKIQQKWASMFFPGFGELGGKINPLIDQYVRARMEDKSTSNINITSILNKNKLAELDKDIVKLRGIYNKVHKDLSSVLGESDLKFGFTKNYLTRGLDIQAIEKDKQGFLDDLVNNVGVLPKGMKEADVTTADRYFEAERIYNDILNGKDPAVMSSEQIRQSVNKKGEGRKGFEKHRDLRWDVLDDKYRKTNAFDSMQDYLGRAATRAASAQVFGGNRAEKLSSTVNQMLKRKLIDSDQASQIWDMYDAEHNIYKRPRNEKERAGQKASRALSAVTAISLLGLASISSITEPAWGVGRVGLANMLKATPTVAAHVVKGIIRTLYSRQGKQANASFGRDLLNVMGMAINPKINEKVEMLMVGDVTPYMTNWFRAPGGLFLTQYTNFVRIWAGVAGLKMIQDQANKVNRLKGQKLSALKNELKENGMTLDDFKKMVRLGNGKIDIMNDAFLDTRFVKSNGSQVAVRDLLVPWVRKITTDVALEPHVGNRPLWMSNPNLQLIAQLKSFPILFGNTIMLRTMRQINPKNCTPSIVSGVGAIGAAATAIALAALALELKDAIRGVDEERGAMDWVAGMGLPYAGTVSGQQLVTPAGVTIADTWLRTPFQDEGSTAENILDLLLRTTLGTIAAEQVK